MTVIVMTVILSACLPARQEAKDLSSEILPPKILAGKSAFLSANVLWRTASE